MSRNDEYVLTAELDYERFMATLEIARRFNDVIVTHNADGSTTYTFRPKLYEPDFKVKVENVTDKP